MPQYPTHPNQLWPGYVPTDSLNPNGAMQGEINPNSHRSLTMQYGRNLAGLGHTEGWNGDSDYDDRDAEKLEKDDDVVGSGVFDMPGHKNTVHETLGVFADHPNLPGYLAREIPFMPSKEVESVPSGAEVIVVPGGGMTWGGRLIGGGTSQPLVPQLPVGGGARPADTFRPGPVGKVQTADAAPQRAVPVAAVRRTSAPVLVREPQAASLPSAPAFPKMAGRFNPDAQRAVMSVPRAPIVLRRQGGMRGFGADASTPSVMSYVLGGALLGAAAAVFKKYVIDKRSR